MRLFLAVMFFLFLIPLVLELKKGKENDALSRLSRMRSWWGAIVTFVLFWIFTLFP